jgi:hypothetical protein
MTTVAYIANEFPSPLEPYVIDRQAISALRNKPSGKRRFFFSRSAMMNCFGQLAGLPPVAAASGRSYVLCFGSGELGQPSEFVL